MALDNARWLMLEVAVGELVAKAEMLSAAAEPVINPEDSYANRSSVTPGGLNEKERRLWRSGLQDDRYLNHLRLCRLCRDLKFRTGGSYPHQHRHQYHHPPIELKFMSLLGCRLCRMLFKSIFKSIDDTPRSLHDDISLTDLANVDPNTLVYSVIGLKIYFELFTTEGLQY
jgi:hypothetical protein